MRKSADNRPEYFKLWIVESDNVRFEFHRITGLPNYVDWMDEYPEQYDWLGRTEAVADRWRPLPCLVVRNGQMPQVFVHNALHRVAFPRAVLGELSKRFPNQFEWLPINVRGQEAENFDPPFVSKLSEQVAALGLHIMHCIRPVRIAEEAQVSEFEPRGKKKKRDVVAFFNVELYAFARDEVEGLDVFFVEQDLSVLCTRRFRDTLRELKLTGLRFDPVRVVIVE